MSRFPARAASVLVASLALSLSASAQNLPLVPPNAPPLTLQDAISRALSKNFDLRSQGISTEQAREALIVAKTDFLPTISGSTSRSISRSTQLIQQPDGSILVRALDQNSTSFGVSVRELIPQTNGTVTLSSNVSRGSNQRPNPYSSDATLQISQPLLQNAGAAIARTNLEKAKISLNVASLNYRSRVLSVVRDTENAYFNLVSARERLRISRNSLELAKKLVDENSARRTSGVATDLEVLTAEGGAATALRNVIQAEQAVRNAEDSLLGLFAADSFDSRPGAVSFEEITPETFSFEVSYKRARDNYPDTLSAEQQIKSLELDLANAKRNQLPQVNLTASMRINTTDTSYGNALTSLPDDHGDARTLGVTYSIPWGMEANRSRYRTTKLSLSSQKLRLEQLEQTLLVQIRTAIRSIETNKASVEVAANDTALRARTYELQKARFDAGLSTARAVTQAQDDLESARVSELAAKVALRSAIADLHRLEGTSLDQFNIKLPQ